MLSLYEHNKTLHDLHFSKLDNVNYVISIKNIWKNTDMIEIREDYNLHYYCSYGGFSWWLVNDYERMIEFILTKDFVNEVYKL